MIIDIYIMSVNYIYLLQVREFIGTNIYKVGRTEKENFVRFNQYPNGSILLFQMICINCKIMETLILRKFREIFKQQTLIGKEYFEGNYQQMIDIIYQYIREEKYEDKEEKYTITTYEEWLLKNDVQKIIIKNKTKHEGYLKLTQSWTTLYDKDNSDYSSNDMETLEEYIEIHQPLYCKLIHPYNDLLTFFELERLIYTFQHKITNAIINYDEFDVIQDKENYIRLENKEYKFMNIEYDKNKILKDTISKCYTKDYEFYKMKYHEYIIYISDNCFILDMDTCTYSPLPMDKILIDNRPFKKNLEFNDICIDTLLDSLVSNDIKQQYKKLLHNLFVEECEIIFIDGNECLLTLLTIELLESVIGLDSVIYSEECYKKININRCVIINQIDNDKVIKQVNNFRKLGFKNFIIKHSNAKIKYKKKEIPNMNLSINLLRWCHSS